MTFLAGQTLRAADLNLFADPPLFSAYQNAAQSLTTGVFTAIQFQVENEDPKGMHSTVTNTDRIIPTVAGLYAVYGQASFAASSTGVRIARIQLNGAAAADGLAPYNRENAPSATTATVIPVMAHVRCNGTTDYVQLAANHNVGASLNTARVSQQDYCFIMLRWVGP